MNKMPAQIRDAVKKVLLENKGYFITVYQIYGELSGATRKNIKAYTEKCNIVEKTFSQLHAVAEAAKMVANDTDGSFTRAAGWKNCRLYRIKAKAAVKKPQ